MAYGIVAVYANSMTPSPYGMFHSADDAVEGLIDIARQFDKTDFESVKESIRDDYRFIVDEDNPESEIVFSIVDFGEVGLSEMQKQTIRCAIADLQGTIDCMEYADVVDHKDDCRTTLGELQQYFPEAI